MIKIFLRKLINKDGSTSKFGLRLFFFLNTLVLVLCITAFFVKTEFVLILFSICAILGVPLTLIRYHMRSSDTPWLNFLEKILEFYRFSCFPRLDNKLEEP